ncbi:hypothetical protein [Flavobacterium croceum]|uniref:hypothetical protein n=1 Tax=Flavobacterium croceum TaxID=370975 RepID=UPI0024A89A54|nr:hypothetical protein [Flavobacterium croceum]
MDFLFKLYIKSSIHVGFAMVFFALITYHNFSIVVDSNYVVIVFLGTLICYNFLKYSRLFFDIKNQNRLLKSIFTITAITIFILPFFCYKLLFKPFSLLVSVVVLVFLYPKIRVNGVLKIIWLSFVVSCVTVYIPLESSAVKGFQLLVDFVLRFLFVILLMLPFEMNDLEFDQNSIKTIPLRIGIVQTKWLAIFLFVLLLLFYGFCFLFKIYTAKSIVIACLMCGFVCLFALSFYKKYNYYVLYFIIESAPLFWYYLLII